MKISLGHCPLYQDVDHFSVKILKIQHAELPKNISLVGIRNDVHFNVKIPMSAMSGEQEVLDHLGVKILKPRHTSESFTSTIFIFNVTTEYAQEIFISAKESFSNLWGFSSKISINFSIPVLFWVILTLVDIFSSVNTKLLNYRRGDIPKRFMIKKKRTKLRQSRSFVVITLLIIALSMLDTSYDNTSESKLNDTSLISCLLYTSPSPRDGLLSRMPSSA